MRTGFKNVLILLVLLTMLGPAVEKLTAMNRWQTYTNQDGGFSVRLPGKPEEDFRRVPAPSKSVPVRYVAAQAPDGSGIYGVAYMDLPAAVRDPREAVQRMEAVPQALKGQLLSKYDVTVQGHQGREYRFQRDKSVTTLRVFLVGRRMYQLIVTSPTEKVGAEERARFMGSFTLLSGT
jgi:hypothetical protein